MNPRHLQFDIKVDPVRGFLVHIHLTYVSVVGVRDKELKKLALERRYFGEGCRIVDVFYRRLICKDEKELNEQLDGLATPFLTVLEENSFFVKDEYDELRSVSAQRHCGSLWDRNHVLGAWLSFVGRLVWAEKIQWETAVSRSGHFDKEGRFHWDGV